MFYTAFPDYRTRASVRVDKQSRKQLSKYLCEEKGMAKPCLQINQNVKPKGLVLLQCCDVTLFV